MKMKYRGDWLPNAKYDPGDVVAKGRRFLVVNHAGQLVDVAAPPDLSLRGEKGEPGERGTDGVDGIDGRDGRDAVAFTPRGKWKPGTYQPGSVVTHNGSSFVATAETKTEPPGKGWQLLARRGRRGDDGETRHTSSTVVRRTVHAATIPIGFADATVALGDIVYVTETGAAARAIGTGYPQSLAVGVATGAGEITMSGPVSCETWNLTPGTVYYLSTTTPGGMTATFPNEVGNHVVILGVATTPTQINLQIHWALIIGS